MYLALKRIHNNGFRTQNRENKWITQNIFFRPFFFKKTAKKHTAFTCKKARKSIQKNSFFSKKKFVHKVIMITFAVHRKKKPVFLLFFRCSDTEITRSKQRYK